MPGLSYFGSEFVVNTSTPGVQFEETVTALSDGRFVVAWHDGATDAVRARLFDATGTGLGDDFLVYSTIDTHIVAPSITELPGGRFAILWQGITAGASTFRVRVFGPDGSPAGNDFPVDAIANGVEV